MEKPAAETEAGAALRLDRQLCFPLYAAANAHLIWTAVRSQPDCVPHLQAPGPEGQFRAAQSSC